MNKTKIEWCDWTWNPVTGCWGPGGTAEKPNRCPYCYAHEIAKRFTRGHAKVFLENNDPFAHCFYPERLAEPARVKKPSRIFVCSMGDLFGDWVPREWINEVLWTCEACPQHTFIFLTKNPKRYAELGAFPANCWLGATITNQDDANKRIPELLKAECSVRFMSAEPLLGPIDIGKVGYPKVRIKTAPFWVIIGAMTGPRAVKPVPAWVRSLMDQAQYAGIPLFLKDNLGLPVKIQEFPHG